MELQHLFRNYTFIIKMNVFNVELIIFYYNTICEANLLDPIKMT